MKPGWVFYRCFDCKAEWKSAINCYTRNEPQPCINAVCYLQGIFVYPYRRKQDKSIPLNEEGELLMEDIEILKE